MKPVLYIFKMQAASASKNVLDQYYKIEEVEVILHGYWEKYLQQKSEIQTQPTLGGTLMVHLAAMSLAFYRELRSRGQNKETTTQVFYDIAWKVYVKMGKLFVVVVRTRQPV